MPTNKKKLSQPSEWRSQPYSQMKKWLKRLKNTGQKTGSGRARGSWLLWLGYPATRQAKFSTNWMNLGPDTEGKSQSTTTTDQQPAKVMAD